MSAGNRPISSANNTHRHNMSRQTRHYRASQKYMAATLHRNGEESPSTIPPRIPRSVFLGESIIGCRKSLRLRTRADRFRQKQREACLEFPADPLAESGFPGGLGEFFAFVRSTGGVNWGIGQNLKGLVPWYFERACLEHFFMTYRPNFFQGLDDLFEGQWPTFCHIYTRLFPITEFSDLSEFESSQIRFLGAFKSFCACGRINVTFCYRPIVFHLCPWKVVYSVPL